LLVLPLYSINLSINYKAANSNQQELIRTMEVRVQLYMESLEKEVMRLMELKREYILDADLLQLSTISTGMTGFDRIQSILNLQKRMQILRTSSSMIANTNIYIPSMNRTINTYQYELEINEEEFNVMKTKETDDLFVYWDDRMFLNLTFPYDAVSKGVSPHYVFSIEISNHNLYESMNEMMEYEEGGIMLFTHTLQDILTVESSEEMVSNVKNVLSNQMEDSWIIHKERITVENQRFVTISYYSDYTGMVAVLYVSVENIKGAMSQYQRWFWMISILSMFVIIIFSYWIYRIIHRPIRKLTYYFKRLEAGNLDLSIKHKLNDEFGYLYDRFNVMVVRLNDLINDARDHQLKIQQSELKWLQSQINPHFLYNSHFILSRLIRQNENEKAYEFAAYLGDYMKFITKNYAEDISLAEEMQHARSYLGIQALCYESRIDFSVPDIPDSFYSQEVPRLIIQPIIENIFKYAVDTKLESSKLEIEFEVQETCIILSFNDDGNTLKNEQIEELNERLSTNDLHITGLINIHRRLQAKYGAGFGLHFYKSKLGGLLVVMKLKKDEVISDE